MSLSYDDVYARSLDSPAFCNGTEGEEWTAQYCDHCLRDAPFRNMGKGSGCPILLVTLMSRTPAEFLEGPRDEHGTYSMANKWHCIEFKPRGGGGSGEPRPKPDPRGMDGLFERPECRTRMYVQPQEATVNA